MKKTYSKDFKAEALVLAPERKSYKNSRETWDVPMDTVEVETKRFDSDGGKAPEPQETTG